MLCTNCGAENDDKNTSCTGCGIRLHESVESDAAALAGQSRRRVISRQLIITLIVVVVLALGGVTAFLTYSQGVWGGKIMPNPADFQTDASRTLTADLVAKELNDRGIPATTKPLFSGKTKGAYVGLENIQPGERIRDDTVAIVQSSDGPGVPAGTVGSAGDQATKAIKTLETMGVDVHTKSVVVSDAKAHPKGSIVATKPGDGQPVDESQQKDGIYVGIATEGDGVPLEILGQGVDAAKTTLEGQGYSVTISNRPSSKQYVGKVAGCDPAPGSSVDSGSSVTLYEGTDAKGVKDLLTTTSDYDDFAMVSMDLSPLAGKYCKSEIKDPDKDCISFESIEGGYAPSGKALRRKGITGTDNANDLLHLTNYSQDVIGAMIEPAPANGISESDLPMKNHLFLKDWGMFEFYPGFGLRNCGNTVSDGEGGIYCDSGTLRHYDNWETIKDRDKGWTYQMNEFYVYFPVGSDLDSLESSGYFDADSLAEAKKQTPVDSTRPYILARDPSLYETTSIPADFTFEEPSVPANPFVPGNENGKNPLVTMKPAPSDATVYYLVEDHAELNWGALSDANLNG